MATVREAVFELWRERGMTTIFGNPGSTELPMLSDFPADFRYVLGLQESVAVGMADGYAQASGRPTQVNLHTAPGLGNGMGAIFNAQANKAPLLITAGQQHRSLMTLQANLTNRDAVHYAYRTTAITVVPTRTFAGGMPIAHDVVRVSPERIAQARIESHPAVVPTREAFIGRVTVPRPAIAIDRHVAMPITPGPVSAAPPARLPGQSESGPRHHPRFHAGKKPDF